MNDNFDYRAYLKSNRLQSLDTQKVKKLIKEEISNLEKNKIWDFRKYIPNFNFKDIKVGDKIITKSNGSISVENIMKHGWDYNYGHLYFFQDKEKNKSFSNMDLIKRNEFNEKRS